MNPTIPSILRGRILQLPFDAYLKLLALLLEKLGYQDVRLTGRTDWKGRNRGGGFDLTANLPGGLSPRRVIVQAKQFDTTSRLFQRQTDELRGAAIRVGASEAVLITSGAVSSAIDVAGLSLAILPVRLLDGERLLELLTIHQVGVTPNGVLDEALFRRLESEATGNRQSDCTGATFLVTVGVKKISQGARRLPAVRAS